MRLSPRTLAMLEVPEQTTGCYLFPGSRDRDGYGLVTVLDPKRTRGAHRVALALKLGIDVDDLEGLALHTCDNPPCIQRAHLWLGTQTDNMQDMLGKGRGSAARTRCRRGHRLTEDNIYIDRRTGKRRCAICHRRRQAEYDKRK